MLGLADNEIKDLKVYEGKGCSACNNTGYSGRTGIFEVMPITCTIERMIVSRASSAEIRQQAITEGMLTLRTAALEKLKQGNTTVGEVLAVTA